MGAFFARQRFQMVALTMLLAASSAHSSCLSLAGYDGCSQSSLPVSEILLPSPSAGAPVLTEPLTVVTIEARHDAHHDDAHEGKHIEHHWNYADARQHVDDFWHRRDRDYEEFRRHWHQGEHGHHQDDGTPPKPVPLPASLLLFAPGLLVLRAFQRGYA